MPRLSPAIAHSLRAAAVPAALLWLPDLVLRGHRLLAAGVWPALSYLGSVVVSLLLWLLLLRSLTALRHRHWSARPLIWLCGVVLPVLSYLLFVYYLRFSLDPPPSALALILRNHTYMLALIGGEGTIWEWVGLVVYPLLWLAALELLTRRPAPRLRRPWLCRVLAVGLALGMLAGAVARPRLATMADIRAAATVVLGIYQWRFASTGVPTPRRLQVPGSRPARAPDVVIFLHESMSAFVCHPWGGPRSGTPHVSAFLQKHAARSVWFHHASAAASGTDVSVPSIFSGLPPHASREQFARTPLLWDYARALGYRTALFSGQSYDWANFRTFFFKASPLDRAVSAAEFVGSPRVNDSGVDDAVMVRGVLDYLQQVKRDKPLLLVLQFGNSHVPYYYPGQAGDRDKALRYRRSIAYVDRLAQQVITALATSGRLQQTLIISTSDHGENATRPWRPPRGENLDEYNARVPLWVHLPAELAQKQPALLKTLRANAKRRVGNIDILPTLLDLWGRYPLKGQLASLGLDGRSLLRPVPQDRLLIGTETGEIRTWDRTAMAIYLGHRKLHVDATGVRLHDVDADPEEQRDLFDRVPLAERQRFLHQVAIRKPLLEIMRRVNMEVTMEISKMIAAGQ